jgi:hypothetical protein
VELSKRVAIRLGNTLGELEGSDDPVQLLLGALTGAVADPTVLAGLAASRYGLGDPRALLRWLHGLDEERLAGVVTELIETRSLAEVRRAIGVSPCQ